MRIKLSLGIALVVLAIVMFCGYYFMRGYYEEQLRQGMKSSFQVGVVYAIKMQDEQRARLSRCETYGDVVNLAWEKYMLDYGVAMLKELKK